jgi:hypothetical protein
MADNFREHYADEQHRLLDQFSHSLTVIQEPHRLSHDGMVFHASGKVVGLANGADAEFAMIVPAGSFPHVQRVRLDTERGDIDLTMYEGSTFSNDGTPITAHNVNRNSSNTALVIPHASPTITDDGTLFHTHWVPATASGVGASSGVMDINAFGEEWILQSNTKYLFRITNNSGGAIDYRYEFVWYEISYEQ